MAGIPLTDRDRAILASYHSVLEALAQYLGESFEFVLHSLEEYDHSAVKVVNGFHTGRSEGAPITDLALDMLERIQTRGEEDYLVYFARNKEGEPLKSMTAAIRGEQGNVIGLLCINFYMRTPLVDFFEHFFANTSENYRQETFLSQSCDYIAAAVAQAVETVDQNPRIMPSARNREIISLLLKEGVFNLKDSVIRTAALLGISKSTVYLHLRNLSDVERGQEDAPRALQ